MKTHKQKGYKHIVIPIELARELEKYRKPKESYADAIRRLLTLITADSVNTIECDGVNTKDRIENIKSPYHNDIVLLSQFERKLPKVNGLADDECIVGVLSENLYWIICGDGSTALTKDPCDLASKLNLKLINYKCSHVLIPPG